MAHTFEFHECIGKGTYGEVYRVSIEGWGGYRKEVAVKILRATLRPDSEASQRLRDEARLLTALSHRAILQVHDVVVLDDRVGLVSEFVQGQDLKSCIADKDPIPLRPVMEAIAEVASALNAAYMTPSPSGDGTLQLVHRDIKPENIRITPDGRVKLMDFGVARSPNMDREARTRVGAMIGNISYAPPEWVSKGELGPTSDVFGLGCVLYESITGVRLFKGAQQRRLLFMAEGRETYDQFISENLDELHGRCPVAVRELMEEMLSCDVDERATSAVVERFAERLATLCDGPTLKQWCRQHTWPIPKPLSGSWTGMRIRPTRSMFGVTSPALRPMQTPPAPKPTSGKIPFPDWHGMTSIPPPPRREQGPPSASAPSNEQTKSGGTERMDDNSKEWLIGIMAAILTAFIVLDVLVVGVLMIGTILLRYTAAG